ncbi:MAG: glycosyltransferase family 2 protein [Flavobacteriales bacterium]
MEATLEGSLIERCVVIVLNWNGLNDTRKCVDSLLVQTPQAPEIWIVDNGSEAQEYERLVELYGSKQNVAIIKNEQNLGFAKAHNRVLDRPLPEDLRWIACLNNDAVAEPEWLINLVKCAESEECHMVSSKMLQMTNPDRIDNIGHSLLSTGEILPLGFGELASKFTSSIQNIGPCAGACLYHRDLFEKLNGFDERFFVGYEDAELGLRAWLCGYNCVLEPKAIVYHKMGASLNEVRSSLYLAEIQSHVFYTWFKLMPRIIIIRQAPSMIFKYSMVILIDVVFFRYKFLKVMLLAINTAIRERKTTWISRRMFYASNQISRSNSEIIKILTPFLRFDAHRFWQFVVLGRKSNLEA